MTECSRAPLDLARPRDRAAPDASERPHLARPADRAAPSFTVAGGDRLERKNADGLFGDRGFFFVVQQNSHHPGLDSGGQKLVFGTVITDLPVGLW